jgi:hypothetical protein
MARQSAAVANRLIAADVTSINSPKPPNGARIRKIVMAGLTALIFTS